MELHIAVRCHCCRVFWTNVQRDVGRWADEIGQLHGVDVALVEKFGLKEFERDLALYSFFLRGFVVFLNFSRNKKIYGNQRLTCFKQLVCL
jgi:hypothetical protein